MILTGLVWLAACLLHTRIKFSRPGLFAFVAALALAIRLIAWQVPPVFSDDLLRYRWEGRIQTHGLNPYALRPADRPDLLRPGDHALPGRDVKAVYGPLLLLTEHFAYRVSGENLLHLRWPFALADLLTLAVLTRRHGLAALVLYGWCPLAAFQFWSGGHNDSLCLLTLALAWWAFHQERNRLGWLALGAAILTKWWPAMLIPFFARRWRSSPWMLAPAVLLAPLYYTNPTENAQFASGFVGGWRNNDSLYGLLLALTGDLYQAKYLAFTLLTLVIATLALRNSRNLSTPRQALTAVTALLLLSANVHPWYLTWLLPFLIESERPPLYALLWIALAPLTLEPAILWRTTGVWQGSLPSRWLLYLPVFTALFVPVLQRWYHSERKEMLS